MPSADVADARGDAAADAVWTTADYLPQGSWVDVRAGSSSLGDQDLRSSSVATRKALEREASVLTACSSYWDNLPPSPSPVPRNFSWSTSTDECGIAPAAESAPRQTQPLAHGFAPAPLRAFASRGTLRGIRMRDAREEARRTKVDAFKMAARKDSRLNVTFSSCSELHGGSEIQSAPQRRGSSPGIFSSLEPAGPKHSKSAHDLVVAELTVVAATHAEEFGAHVGESMRTRPTAKRMSPQFRAWQKWSDRNTRSISAAKPGLPKTPELARARGKQVAARAKQKLEFAVEKRGTGSRLWKARTGALKGVRILVLEHSGVTDKKAKYLGEEMAFIDPNAGGPVHVLLAENWIGEAGAAAIAQGLAASNCTHRLNLSQNRIGGAGGGHFSQLITPESELRSLDLSDNPLGLASFEALSAALAKRAALKVLRLDRTGAGMGGALESLAYALSSEDCTLKSLSLRKNSIRGLGACALAEALRENTCLHSLELGNNCLSEAPLADGSPGSATRFGIALKENATLRSLDMTHNDIGDKGAQELAAALEHNTTLHKLVLSENLQITSQGCAAFLKAKQMGWVDDIVVTAAKGHGSDGKDGDDPSGLDALVGNGKKGGGGSAGAKTKGGTGESSRAASARQGHAASYAAMVRAGKVPLTVELAGCFTKGNIPASLLIELGML